MKDSLTVGAAISQQLEVQLAICIPVYTLYHHQQKMQVVISIYIYFSAIFVLSGQGRMHMSRRYVLHCFTHNDAAPL